MKCQCGAAMIIDEWEGWFWACLSCGAKGRLATDYEIEEQHESMNDQRRQK